MVKLSGYCAYQREYDFFQRFLLKVYVSNYNILNNVLCEKEEARSSKWGGREANIFWIKKESKCMIDLHRC